MRLLLLLTSGALLLGLLPLPIGYYTFLRILVTVAAVIVAATNYKGHLETTQVVFGIIAIIFNPLLPIYLHDKGVWAVIDLAAAVVFIGKAFSIPSTKTP